MLLPILHLFNDGYLAAMPLILPFASEEFNLSLSIIGILGSLLSFSGIILAIPAGSAAMRMGAVRLLGTAVMCYGLGFLLLGFSTGLFTVFLSFVLGSIAFGIFHPVAFSAVAKSSSSCNLGKDMGVFAATGDIGKIAFASAVTFIIGLTSWRLTSILYGAAAIILFIICFFASFTKSRDIDTDSVSKRRKMDFHILANRRFAMANAASLIDSFANSSLFIFIPFLIAFRGFDAAFIGIFTSIFFIGNLLGKVVMGKLSDGRGKEKLFAYSEFCIFISLSALAIIQSIYAISVLAAILGFFTKGTVPITSTMIAESVDKHDFEAAYSINSLSTSIANTISPLLFGFLADFIGIQSVFFACGIAALFSTLPALMVIRIRKNQSNSFFSSLES